MEGQVYIMQVVVMHLAWTEGNYGWLPQVLERDRSTASVALLSFRRLALPLTSPRLSP